MVENLKAHGLYDQMINDSLLAQIHTVYFYLPVLGRLKIDEAKNFKENVRRVISQRMNETALNLDIMSLISEVIHKN